MLIAPPRRLPTRTMPTRRFKTPLVSALAIASVLLLAPSMAGAEPASEISIADYPVALGPDAVRSADGRGGDRSYLAQIRFQGFEPVKRVSPAPVPTPQQDSQTVLAERERAHVNSQENVQIALRRVVELESALWKRDNANQAIAGNRLAAPLHEARTEYAANEVIYGPQALPAASATNALVVARCGIDKENRVTLAQADSDPSNQSTPALLSVTPAQDPSAESC